MPSPVQQRRESNQRGVELFCKVARAIPVHWGKRRFFDSFLARRKHERFDFSFYCRGLDLHWSASAFPDLLTRHMMIGGAYQSDVICCLDHLLKPGMIFFDVGAHHGLMTVYAARKVGAAGKVFAFEPNPAARRHLDLHLRLNHLENVAVEAAGFLDQKGTADFFPVPGEHSWNSSFVRDFADPGQTVAPIQVPIYTLDEFVATGGVKPDVIKIDTEGTEFRVLRGGQCLLQHHRPVLIIEINAYSISKSGSELKALLDLLVRCRYDLFTLKRSIFGSYKFARLRRVQPEPEAFRDSLLNVLCVPA
jgi:FkbM family methyltransferase